jgi:hypothetical protein
MKFTPSGKRNLFAAKRSNLNTSPGSLLGEKRIACVRCCNEFPVSQLKKIPPKSDSYRYICLNCLSVEERINEE